MRVGLVAVAGILSSTAAAAQLPPVRQLGAPVATITESFPGVPSIRALSDGRLMVSDMNRRRLMIYDSSLAKPKGILNPAGSAATTFPAQGGLLIPLAADSTLVFDAAGSSFMQLDPEGNVTRVMAVPRPSDAFVFRTMTTGLPVIDSRMRLIYRTRMPFTAFSRATGQAILPDTTPVIAVPFETRQADTIAWMKIPKAPPSVSGREADGRLHVTSIQPPFQLVDEWAALHDGTVAVIRWKDYHVDWYSPDGKKESSPKTAWNWVRLTDDDKAAFIDTLKTLFHQRDSVQQTQIQVFGSGPIAAPIFETLTVAPSEVPDYPPPFVGGATRVDLDDRIWLLERVNVGSKPAGLIYDLIDRTGLIVDRVQLPPNAAVIGFGPGHAVYLSITPSNAQLAMSLPAAQSAGPGGPAMGPAVKVAKAILPPR
jgi:hypothetical protein